MSLNWVFVTVLAGIGLAWSNPGHNLHHAALSPALIAYLKSVHGDDLEGAGEHWTFLPKRLNYNNYYIFSTTAFPGPAATSKTPVAGTLTVGLLGKVFVLFPKNA